MCNSGHILQDWVKYLLCFISVDDIFKERGTECECWLGRCGGLLLKSKQNGQIVSLVCTS